MPDVAAVELRGRHHPVQHRRQIEIRRHRLRTVGIRIDVEELVASGRERQDADPEYREGLFHGQNPTLTPTLMPRGMGKFPKSIPTAPEPPTPAVLPLTIGS